MTGHPQNQSFCRRIVVVSKSLEIETYQSNIAFVPKLVFEKCWKRIRSFHQGNQVVVLSALYVICMPLRFWYVSAVPTLLKNTKNLQHQLCWFWISRWGRQGGCDDAARRSDLVWKTIAKVLHGREQMASVTDTDLIKAEWRGRKMDVWQDGSFVLFTALACYLAININPICLVEAMVGEALNDIGLKENYW